MKKKTKPEYVVVTGDVVHVKPEKDDKKEDKKEDTNSNASKK